MATVADILGSLKSVLGRPYVWGGESPTTGFDCSGLMQWAFAQHGINLPRTAEDQQRATTPVDNPAPGDLVFWGNPATHVAFYIGNGHIIAAPHTGDVVKVQSVYGSPTYGRVTNMTGPAADNGSPLTSSVGSVITAGRGIVMEAAFIGAGVILMITGVNRMVKQRITTQAKKVLS
jgi:hypothetical protein